jgi:hypothetical protein
MKAAEVFRQNNADVTKAYYAKLAAKGFYGELAVALFRAQKRSTAAKRYRGSRYRNAAYEAKNWSLIETCRILLSDSHRVTWGWGRDPKTPGFEWVLYVDLPGGFQVSFHSAVRLSGPEYPGEWDGQPEMSEPRILAFCDAVMTSDSAASLVEKIVEYSRAKSGPSRNCRCAVVKYRNNEDGSRDVKVEGNLKCQICRGRGWIARCDACAGTGMAPGGGTVCPECLGNGATPSSAPVEVYA